MTTPSDMTPAPEPAPPAPVVTPPTKWLLAYRLLGMRLPEEYHPWLLQDAASKSFLTWRSLRTFVWGEIVLWLALLGYRATTGHLPTGGWSPRGWLFRWQLVVLAVVLFSSRDALVRRVLRWHRIDKHGRPVEKVKPFARLSNLEAVAFGAVMLVLCGAAGAVYGDVSKPRGAAAAPCREADPNVMDRIRAGQTNTGAKYLTTRMVRIGEVDVVIAVTDLGEAASTAPSPSPAPTASGSPRPPGPLIEVWLVRADGISRLGDDPKASTGFPVLTQPDRGITPALSRAAECLSKKPVR